MPEGDTLWRTARTLARALGENDGAPARVHFLARFLEEAGFVATANGYQMRRVAPVLEMDPGAGDEEEDEGA